MDEKPIERLERSGPAEDPVTAPGDQGAAGEGSAPDAGAAGAAGAAGEGTAGAAARAERAPEPEAPAAAGVAGGVGEADALRAELERLKGEVEDWKRKYDELYDRYLRVNADFDNYRKRVAKERAEDSARAQADLLKDLLEPLDDLARALAMEPTSDEARALHEGLRLAHEKLQAALARAGLEVLEVQGEAFDPELHEAVLTVEADHAQEDGRIAGAVSRGYRFRGRMLRPAQVQVKRYRGDGGALDAGRDAGAPGDVAGEGGPGGAGRPA